MSDWDELSPLEIDNARLRADLATERERAGKERMYRDAVEQAERITIKAFKREQANVAKLREAMAKARGLVSGAFVNRRLDHDVAIFQHSAVMEAIADIDAVLAETGGDRD